MAPVSTDWSEWHEAYSRPGSGLDDRLAAVRAAIHCHLDAAGSRPVQVVSACAGDGRDLIGALSTRNDDDRVTGILVEHDAQLAHRARDSARAADACLEVCEGDAAESSIYAGWVPADLVLMCGVFGNISDTDVKTTINVLPQLCTENAEVIWTRHRHLPDLTPSIRDWFAEAGFEEVSFVAPVDDSWSVGTHRLIAPPRSLQAGARWFTFIR